MIVTGYVGNLYNTAEILTGGIFDNNTGNNIDDAMITTVPVPSADIEITKSVTGQYYS